MTRLAPSPIRRAGLGLLLLACAGAPLSCSSGIVTREQRQIEATARIADPIRVLQARAELETLNPLPAPSNSLIRRLVHDTTEPLTPGTAAYRRSMLSADEIELVTDFEATETPDEPDATKRRHAIKLYTRARALRQHGQLNEAAQVLERAGELDPSAASIMISLGDVRSAMGDAVGASNAYERALGLGDRSATPLIYIATREHSLGNDERVMALCTLALQSSEIDTDSAPGALAGIMLGNAQIRQGYLRAGAESLQNALDAFDPSDLEPRWRREVVQIMGRRASLWVVAGDAWSKIGAHTRAAESYARAAELSDGVSTDLAARRLAALLREGRPSTAALLLIEHIQENAADVTRLEGDWVQVLTEIPSLRPVLQDAIASIRESDGLAPSVRRGLLALEVRGLNPSGALQRLAQAGPDANNPDPIVAVLRTLEAPRAQHDWALRLLDRNPHTTEAIAQAWSRLPTPLTERLGLIDTSTAEGQLLATTLAVRMGRADLLTHLDGLPQGPHSDRTNAWLEFHSQACVLTGRWEAARTLHEVLGQRADQGDRDAARRSAACLLTLQQPQKALALATELAQSDSASVFDLLQLVRIALTLEENDAALTALQRAWVLDPYDTGIADRLIRLRGSGAPLEDEDAIREIVRKLSERRPRSVLFSLLRASDLARNGLMREAERAVLTINAQPGRDLVGDDLLLSIWKTQQTQGQQDALHRGADWLRERLAQNPNSVGATLALAQIQYELEDFEQSLKALESAWIDTGSFEIARLREQLIRGELGEPDHADELAKARLGSFRGVDPSIEYARTLARVGDAPSATMALEVLSERIPSEVDLMPAQLRQISQVVYEMAEHAEVDGIDEAMLGVIAFIEDRAGPLDFFMARTKVLLLTRADDVDIDRLIEVADHHADGLENQEDRFALRALPVQVLLGEDRPHLAIAYTTRMAIGTDEVNEDALIETFRLLGAVGVNSDLLGVLDALDAAGQLLETIVITTRRFGTPARQTEGLEVHQKRADLAYTAGALAAAFQRQEQSDAFMQLALSFDPEHGWSNNDLGYTLIERGERIDEAGQMIETAARVLPDQASVIDSLGWLRYKQGIFEDRVDEMTGTVMMRGAISLLTQANMLDRSRTNATILLHLGDAHWRAGDKEKATEAWLKGESMLRSRVRMLSAQPEQNRGAIEAASRELRTLRYRIQDAEAGGTPDIAPIFDDPGSN